MPLNSEELVDLKNIERPEYPKIFLNMKQTIKIKIKREVDQFQNINN